VTIDIQNNALNFGIPFWQLWVLQLEMFILNPFQLDSSGDHSLTQLAHMRYVILQMPLHLATSTVFSVGVNLF